jgi:DNA-binding beta-propeller fold protein YncE
MTGIARAAAGRSGSWRPWMPVLAMLVVALAGCKKGAGEMASLARVQLPDSVAAGATLAVDSLRRAWVGTPGRLTVYDTAGREASRLAAGGQLVPRVLWMSDSAVYVRAGGNVSVIDPGTRKRAGTRQVSPVARDPRGRWVYTAGRRGGVLGLAPGTLKIRWGWPDAGAAATALAVSPLGDRVYVALDASERNETAPAVEVRDAQSGRPLHRWEAPGPVTVLEAGPDNTLYAVSRGSILALRHGSEGLVVIWTSAVEGDQPRLRVSPTGTRVAVLGNGDEGVRLLETGSGKVVGRTDEAPRDAAFDVGGRLWVLYPREIRIIR